MLGAVTTFRPSNLSGPAGGIVVALVMMAVIVPTAAIWAAGGEAVGRLVAGRRVERVVGLGTAALPAATVVFVWI